MTKLVPEGMMGILSAVHLLKPGSLAHTMIMDKTMLVSKTCNQLLPTVELIL